LINTQSESAHVAQHCQWAPINPSSSTLFKSCSLSLKPHQLYQASLGKQQPSTTQPYVLNPPHIMSTCEICSSVGHITSTKCAASFISHLRRQWGPTHIHTFTHTALTSACRLHSTPHRLVAVCSCPPDTHTHQPLPQSTQSAVLPVLGHLSTTQLRQPAHASSCLPRLPLLTTTTKQPR
jgi:hypothetical protein